MIQNTVDALTTEAFLAEMLCKDRRRHLLEISHLVDRNPTTDDFFHIRIRNIRNIPHFIAGLFHFIPLIHLRDDLFCVSKKSDKLLISLTFLRHRIIGSHLYICQILKQFLLCVQTDLTGIYQWCIFVTFIRFQLFILFFQFLCLVITKLLRIAVPIDHLIRIVKIEILLSQHSCQEIGYIFRTHTKSKSQ